ncbi:MAG: transglycosylase domain-containing protein, partial [Acidobacteria bacterium]|nr:transglycosylase domain-containing protein [Acidobacteriota bacterium]
MAIKVRVPQRSGRRAKSRRDPVLRAALAAFLVLAVVFTAGFSYLYVKYEQIIARRFDGQVFANSAKIYARPVSIAAGDKADLRAIAADLRHAGYAEKGGQSSMGSYRLTAGSIQIQPGPGSYHSPESATIRVHDGRVENITASSGTELEAYELEPEMITSLFEGDQRSKRQVVHYNEMPKVLVDAVLAIEDRRFFQHNGINFLRFAEAAWIDLTRPFTRQVEQG